MITLAFAQMIYYFAVSLPAYGGADGLPIYLRGGLPLIDTGDPLSFFLACYALLLLALFLTHRLVGSRFGAALQCARMNPERLATLGIAPFPVKLTAFTLSALVTGLAGALFADLNGFVSTYMPSWQRYGANLVIVIIRRRGALF